jgi:hypothetical protein
VGLAAATAMTLAPIGAVAQGCIGAPNCPNMVLIESDFQGASLGANQWLASAGFRWFQSKRVFSGDQEIPQRYGQMVNEVYSVDFSATYGISSRWSVSLDVPLNYATRTTTYEHSPGNPNSMTTWGIGDVQVTTDFWLFNPHTHMNGNVALGIGFSAPTGDADATDTAYRATGPVTRPVDPSIQPGSGGWGIIFELQGYQKIYKNLFGYVDGFYIMTPEEQNGTQYTTADNRFVAAFLTPLQTYNSIPDQFMGRAGFSYVAWPEQGLTVSLGARVEGIPANDVIGESMGYRRPGYTVSIEPGVSWSYKRNSLSITAPVSVYYNRTQSAPESALGRPPGDAGFADFSILANFTHRF